MLLFGCRPSEATYIIHKPSFEPNTSREYKDCDWVATVPPTYNKTKLLYTWGVPKKMNWMVELVYALHEHEPDLKDKLGDPKKTFRSRLDYWFRFRVLVDAAKESDYVAQRNSSGRWYNMRTVRTRHGTDYYREYKEAQRL